MATGQIARTRKYGGRCKQVQLFFTETKLYRFEVSIGRNAIF